jgi:hypothetical protein
MGAHSPPKKNGVRFSGLKRPYPLSSRPERSAVERSAVRGPFLEIYFDRGITGLRPTRGDKNGSYSATTLPGSTALPFVISTEAQRSGEICGSAILSWECFSTEESWAFWPTQGDEKRLLFSNDCRWRHRPPLCHLDRSVAQWRDLRFGGSFLEMFFDRGVMGLWPTQGDEKRLLFSNDCRWRHRPPLCHLDRSVPGFPTSRC